MIDRADIFQFRDDLLEGPLGDAGKAEATDRYFGQAGGQASAAIDLAPGVGAIPGDVIEGTIVTIEARETSGLGVELALAELMTAKPDKGTGGNGGGKPDKGDGGGGGGGGGGKGGGKPGGGGTTDPGLLDSYLSSAAGSLYNIEIIFSGSNWSTDLQDAFVIMADFLSSQVIGDLSDEFVPFVGAVDDLKIDASISVIDGAGGILGQAGPSSYRTATNETPWLPASGIMEFDLADAEALLAQGTFDDVVLHEMLHVMGIGTAWDADRLDLINFDTSDGTPRFSGTQANAEYLASSYATGDANAAEGVPIETDGGAGTAFGHWDEAQLGDEIMTGYLGASAVWTDITLAALDDMGYDTIYLA